MSKQTKNSCARAFGNQSRNKNLRLKESSGGGGGQIDPPPLCLLGLRSYILYILASTSFKLF